MGKRKNSDKEEYIARKIKKLERKMTKVRRRRRRLSSSSESSETVQSEPDVIIEPELDNSSELEVQPTEEPHRDNIVSAADVGAQPEPELHPNILNILGDEPAKEETFSKAIHKDIAIRWSDILINGLKEEIKKDLIKSYDIPENLTLARNPVLNPEVKAAVNENAIKRDAILSEKQSHLACVIKCVADLITSTLENANSTMEHKEALKLLSDAGRLLCHIHYSETISRRNFLLACLSKDVKDNIKDLKRDQFLFGSELSEKLKSLKAITKTGVEMRHAPPKPKQQARAKQPEPSTSRALNWRGPPPPAAPRRAFPRPTSTAGGRRQPAATARGSSRRNPKARSKTNRR